MAPALTGGPGCSCLLVRIPSSVMLLPLRGCWHHVFATSPALSPMCWLSGLPSFTLQGSLRMSCSCPGEPAQGGDRWRLLEGPRQAPQGPKVCSGLTVLGTPGVCLPSPIRGTDSGPRSPAAVPWVPTGDEAQGSRLPHKATAIWPFPGFPFAVPRIPAPRLLIRAQRAKASEGQLRLQSDSLSPMLRPCGLRAMARGESPLSPCLCQPLGLPQPLPP